MFLKCKKKNRFLIYFSEDQLEKNDLNTLSQVNYKESVILAVFYREVFLWFVICLLSALTHLRSDVPTPFYALKRFFQAHVLSAWHTVPNVVW